MFPSRGKSVKSYAAIDKKKKKWYDSLVLFNLFIMTPGTSDEMQHYLGEEDASESMHPASGEAMEKAIVALQPVTDLAAQIRAENPPNPDRIKILEPGIPDIRRE